MSSKKKSLEIETLRGLACLLLVLYHVIGPLGGGLKIDLGSPFRVIADSMVYVRMPLGSFFDSSTIVWSSYEMICVPYIVPGSALTSPTTVWIS